MNKAIDEFFEIVMGFQSEPNHVSVTFSKHAGVFRLPVGRSDFVSQMTNIAAAFKTDVEVKVMLRGDEIISVG